LDFPLSGYPPVQRHYIGNQLKKRAIIADGKDTNKVPGNDFGKKTKYPLYASLKKGQTRRFKEKRLV